jgi:hypothetical protein
MTPDERRHSNTQARNEAIYRDYLELHHTQLLRKDVVIARLADRYFLSQLVIARIISGQNSSTRKGQRNTLIRQQWADLVNTGTPLDQAIHTLAQRFYLSPTTIERIVNSHS